MHFKQFYLGCLAHASYFIGSEGEAAVVDPQRDIEQYVAEAEAGGFRIKYVLETHLHADFVSGHHELAERTGAEIVFGEKANAEFPHLAVADGDELRVGKVRLHILATPGHTPESISILVTDTEASDRPKMVLTGDTLFIGDVGRPDLVGAKGYSAEQMAGMLHDSLHEKLLKLDDSVIVYPAHGAGSMCGRNISTERSSTIGDQKRFNYALKPMSREAFVALMTTDLPEAPAYFSYDAELNRSGAIPLHQLLGPTELSASTFRELIHQGCTVLDVRTASEFLGGHVPGSVNIGLGGQFASWTGSLLHPKTPILLIAEDSEKIEEASTRLARIGMETVKGFLGGGMYAWSQAGFEAESLPQVTVDELSAMLAENPALKVLDVRRPAEYNGGHVPGAVNVPLGPALAGNFPFESNEQTAVICAGGYRSSAAVSLLARNGIKNVVNVVGGTGAWVQAGFPVEGAQTAGSCSTS